MNIQYLIHNTHCKKVKGFTLMELLLYSGILVISAGLIGGIFYTVSKSSLKTQAENEVNNQMARLEEIFRQKIEAAKGVNTISGSLLELNMGTATTTFSLSNNVVYLQEGGGSQLALNDSNKVKVTSLLFTPTGASGAQISNTYHYAWSGNYGWIDFAYPGGNVRVPIGAGDLNGGAYVLSDSSWISLNCSFTDSCSTVDYKVSSDANGKLSGWAWSESFGWISFASTTPITYGVTVATSTGEFDGYAWSENIGWISFNCKTGGDNQTDICSTSNYKVIDLRSQNTSIKIDITIQYNSTKPELAVSRTNTFVFNILTPSK
jgi:type II secretory pathway pseudopilin PulG